MVEAIVNGLFNLITMLGNLITAPLVSGITALIPRIWQYYIQYKILF